MPGRYHEFYNYCFHIGTKNKINVTRIKQFNTCSHVIVVVFIYLIQQTWIFCFVSHCQESSIFDSLRCQDLFIILTDSVVPPPPVIGQ